MRAAPGNRVSRLSVIGAVALLTYAGTPVLSPAGAASVDSAAEDQAARDVMFVGNNWDGTVDLLDASTFATYQRIDVVPDLEQRKAE
ncbi:MAG TPA: hypothetical protein VF423_09310, partial [Actinomycetes bacterium]